MLVGMLPQTALAASNDEVISGATAAFDYVYSYGDTTENVTTEAAEDDGEEFDLFPDEDSDDQYLYMGMQTVYDKIYFDIEDEIEFDDDDDAELEWQYRDEDSSWNTLKITSDKLEDFLDEGTGYITFEIPDDWDTNSFQSHSAYWVRVKPEEDVEEAASIEQISARAYTVFLEVEDDDNDEVENLTISDFELDEGDDDKIYAVREVDDGEYQLAIMAEGDDVSYELTIDDSRYEEDDINVTAKTNPNTYQIELEEDDNNNDDDDVYLSGDCDDGDDMPFDDLSGHWARSEVENLYCRGVVSGKSYYYFMPDEEITRAEFLKIILLNADEDMDDYDDENEPFDDVHSSDWFEKYVVAGYELDLIDKEDEFRPHDTINRAEAVTMLVRLADVSTSSSSTVFDDVDTWDWYAKYVRSAYSYGIIEGYNDNTFRANNPLTRGEAAVMADNAYDSWFD